MLNLYYSRDNKNQSRFLYEHIEGRTIVIVPDQYTVQAEREAFFYRQGKGMMDLEVLSLSRLSDRVFSEAGGGRVPMIDRQGRHMLLTRLMRHMKDQLKIYRHYERRPAFLDMVNDFISEAKQYGRTPEDLRTLSGQLGENRYLRRKMEDLTQIFQQYEAAIRGKYIDTEDRISRMAERMKDAGTVRESRFWVMGFDWLSPKNLEILRELMHWSRELNVILTWDDTGSDQELFALTGSVMDDLEGEAFAMGIPFHREEIGNEYRESRPAAIAAIEQNLFAFPAVPTEKANGLTLVRAADTAAEAETAAAEVLRLVREKGMRYRDIALICNDLTTRGSIYKRVFAQYGINLFVDEKRSIMHHPAVNYIIALTDIIAGGYRPDDVLRLIKTGLTDLSDDAAEVFENYVRNYRISGPLFRKPLTRGATELDPEMMKQLETSRKSVIDPVVQFAAEYHGKDSVQEKVECLYRYLTDTCRMTERIAQNIDEAIQEGELEQAGESAQIWNVIVGIFDQMVEITGDLSLSQKDFAAMFRSGFEAVEIGLIPPSLDGLMMGNMKRTRTGTVRAMLVLGANEGILPAEPEQEGLLSEEDRLELLDTGEDLPLSKLDRLRGQEEELAIYRNLAGVTEELWISCSASGEEGEALRPSRIMTAVQHLCPSVPVQEDILSREDAGAMLSAPEAGLTHLTEALRRFMNDGMLEEQWKAGLHWYQAHRTEETARITEGLLFRNTVPDLRSGMAGALYRHQGILTLSPSRLEQFGRCPFAHFIHYGLHPQEPVQYKVDPAGMGSLYHRCMMEMAQQLTKEDMMVTDPASPWMTMEREPCDAMTDQILEAIFSKYREGLFDADREEAYRGKRAKSLCRDAVWEMVEQVRKGTICSMEQEVPFEQGAPIRPVTIETEQGPVRIEGIIDRVDYLPEGRVKVIDYKSGSDRYQEDEALGGWKLQLFVYLRAACEESREPAGAFYFHLPAPVVDVTGIGTAALQETVSEELRKAFRMDGFLVDDPDVIQAFDETGTGSSSVIPVRWKKDGTPASGSKLLPRAELEELIRRVGTEMDTMCRRLSKGEIRIWPARMESGQRACRYCRYPAICRFDVTFPGCEYRDIRKRKKQDSGKGE